MAKFIHYTGSLYINIISFMIYINLINEGGRNVIWTLGTTISD